MTVGHFTNRRIVVALFVATVVVLPTCILPSVEASRSGYVMIKTAECHTAGTDEDVHLRLRLHRRHRGNGGRKEDDETSTMQQHQILLNTDDDDDLERGSIGVYSVGSLTPSQSLCDTVFDWQSLSLQSDCICLRKFADALGNSRRNGLDTFLPLTYLSRSRLNKPTGHM